MTIRFPLGTTSNSSGTPPDTPRATPPGTPPDTPRPTPRATQRRVPLVKQGGKARLSLPVDLKNRADEKRAEKPMTPRGKEKAWTSGKVDKAKPQSWHLVKGFACWLEDVNGKPEQGAAILRELAQAAPDRKTIDKLAGEVVASIKGVFLPEEIGAVIEKVDKLDFLLISCPQFYAAFYDKLVALQNRQIAPSQPHGEISFEEQYAQGMNLIPPVSDFLLNEMEPVPQVATEETRTTTPTTPTVPKDETEKPVGHVAPEETTTTTTMPKRKPKLKLPKMPKLGSLKLDSLPSLTLPKFTSPITSPRSPFATPRSPFARETGEPKAPSMAETAPPALGPDFDRAAWNAQGEEATAEFISQLIGGEPKSMKESYYEGLYPVIRIVTDRTEAPDVDELNSWIDKALVGKSNDDLRRIAETFGKDFGAKGAIFKNFSHRLYMRLLDRPSPVGRVGADLNMADRYMLAITNNEPRTAVYLDGLLFGRLRSASHEDEILVAKKFEALCAPTLEGLTLEQLMRFGRCLSQRSGTYAERLLPDVFTRALWKLPEQERKAIMKQLGW